MSFAILLNPADFVKNADALAAFLGIPVADAAKIAETVQLFVDSIAA